MSDLETSLVSGPARGVVDPANPWPGLEAFREADRAFFHGRGAEAAELLRRVMRRKMTLLFSPSGLGKTSLLRAGLFPRLRAENVLPVYIRLDFSPESPRFGEQILEDVVSQIRQAGGEAPVPQRGDTLWEYFQKQSSEFWNHCNRPALPLLVIDQFEEIFTLGKRDAARTAACASLLDELMQLAEGRPPAHLVAQLELAPERVRDFEFGLEGCKLLIALREDFLPHFEELPLAPLAFDRSRLRAMNGTAAMEVAGQAPELIDVEVAERVVRFVAGPRRVDAPLSDLEVDPALLSVMCRELNERRRTLGETKITGDLLEGNKNDLLAGFYERNVAGLPPGMRSFVEEKLLTVLGDRDSIAFENALTFPGVTESAIEQLVENRLVRIEDRAGSRRLELTHDLLTGVIVASRDERRLREAEEQERRARVAAEEEARETLRKLRRSRILAVVFVALFLLALLSAGWAFWAQGKARRAEEVAKMALTQKEIERERADHAWKATEAALANSDAARRLELEARQAALQALAKTEAARKLASISKAGAEEALGNQYYSEALALAESGQFLKSLAFFARAATLVPGNTAARAHIVATLLRIGGPAANLEFHHDAAIKAAEFSPDGLSIVAAGADGKVLIWDAVSGEILGQPVHTGATLFHASISPDGRRLLTADIRTAQVWNIATGAKIGQPLLHRGYPVTTAEFSPDGETILTSSYDGTSRLWTKDGVALGETMVHAGAVSAATFSPDGKLVVTASEDTTAAVWSAATGALVHQLPGHQSIVHAATFSPDSRRVLTATEDGSLQVWDLGASKNPVLKREYSFPVFSAWFNHDGSKIIATIGGKARILDAGPQGNGSDIGSDIVIAPEGNAAILSAKFSQDGSKILTTTSDRQAQAWSTATTQPIGPPIQHQIYLRSAEFSPDGNRIVTAAWDGTTRVQSLFAANLVGEPLGPRSLEARELQKREPQPSRGDFELVLRNGRKTLEVHDSVTGTLVGRALNHQEPVTFSTFCDDLRFILTKSASTVRLWNLDADSSFSFNFSDPWGEALDCQVHENLIAVTGVRTAAVLDFKGRRQIGGILDSGDFIAGLAFSPSGERIALTTSSGRMKIWDIESRRTVSDFRVSAENVPNSSSFGASGSLLATVSEGIVKLWDVEAGVLLVPPLTLPENQNVVKFSSSGQRLLTSSRAWDFPTYSEAETPELANLAETVSSLALGDRSQIEELPTAERKRRLAALRELGSKAPANEPTVASLIKWFFTPRFERTISPLSKMTVEQYIAEMLAIGTPQARREAEENFPGHPLLVANTPSAKAPVPPVQ